MYPIQNAYMPYTYISYLYLPLVQYCAYGRCHCTTFHLQILTRMYTLYLQMHKRYLYVCVIYGSIVLIYPHVYVVNVCILCVCVGNMRTHTTESTTLLCGAVFATISCSVSQCVAVCCSVLQCVAVCCSVLQCISVYFSVLQCVAVYLCCSMLQRYCAQHTRHQPPTTYPNTLIHTATHTLKPPPPSPPLLLHSVLGRTAT